MLVGGNPLRVIATRISSRRELVVLPRVAGPNVLVALVSSARRQDLIDEASKSEILMPVRPFVFEARRQLPRLWHLLQIVPMMSPQALASDRHPHDDTEDELVDYCRHLTERKSQVGDSINEIWMYLTIEQPTFRLEHSCSMKYKDRKSLTTIFSYKLEASKQDSRAKSR